MKKWMSWIVLAAMLIFLTGCRTTSSATVKVTNKGAVKIQVNISGSIMQIGPGQTGTFDFTWDGRNPSLVQLLAYPVGDPTNYQAQTLELNHGDVLSIDILLTSN